MSQKKTISTSGLASEDESQPFQKPSVMHLNSSSCQKHKQHLRGQVYIPSACDQLYANYSLYKHHMQTTINPPISRSRPCTQCVSGTNGNVPLLKSPCTLNYYRSVNYSCSCKSHTITPACDSNLETSPELPPVLHLNKQPAATMPDGISCEIHPYPEQSGVIITKTDPSSTGDAPASSLPHGELEKSMNSAHEVVRTVDVTKLGMTDDRFHCEKLD